MEQTLKPVRLQTVHQAGLRIRRSAWRGLFLFVALCYSCTSYASSEDSTATSGGNPGQLAQIAQDLCGRLHLNDHVEVQINEQNAKMVSSEPLPNVAQGFRISFDRVFLESLSDDEITAAMAHELGHIWIFTHHPFLQTEALANDIALRVVDRETMKRVYSKMWAHTGTAGNLNELLGPGHVQETEKAAAKILP
jgi:hypothetical protein